MDEFRKFARLLARLLSDKVKGADTGHTLEDPETPAAPTLPPETSSSLEVEAPSAPLEPTAPAITPVSIPEAAPVQDFGEELVPLAPTASRDAPTSPLPEPIPDDVAELSVPLYASTKFDVSEVAPEVRDEERLSAPRVVISEPVEYAFAPTVDRAEALVAPVLPPAPAIMESGLVSTQDDVPSLSRPSPVLDSVIDVLPELAPQDRVTPLTAPVLPQPATFDDPGRLEAERGETPLGMERPRYTQEMIDAAMQPPDEVEPLRISPPQRFPKAGFSLDDPLGASEQLMVDGNYEWTNQHLAEEMLDAQQEYREHEARYQKRVVDGMYEMATSAYHRARDIDILVSSLESNRFVPPNLI